LTQNWYCYPLLLLALTIIPFLKFSYSQVTYFKNISSLIPHSNFEWISGFRRSFLFLIPVYFLAIVFSWFRFLPLFLLWFITVSIASFYTECEPLHILKQNSLSPRYFLRRKIFLHSKSLVLLCIPVLLVNSIFNIEYWYINVLFLPVQLSLLCFAICLKYSTYRPNINLPGNNIILSLASIGTIVPFFLPIPLILAFKYYGNAKLNLEKYLND